MAAEIVTIIRGFLDAPAKIKQYVVDPIKDQFRYVHRYGDIMEDLRSKNELLTSIRDQLRQRIQAAKDNLHIIVPSVEDWCRRVDQRTEAIDSLLADEPRVQNDTCMQGTCSSLKLRYSRSRKATKLIAEIEELLKEYNEFRSHISDPAPVETILETSGTLEFDSRKQTEEKIMSYLKDPSICMIGVWGMGGLGKTTMAKKIRERARKEKLFDRTAMAVVSQQVEPLKIQQQLAEDLGLDLTKEQTESGRARKLSSRLMIEKVLIILDDVWNWLELEKLIGIPAEIKILLTTRDQGVCQSMTTERTSKIVKLELLNVEEAFSLFRNKAGVDQSNLLPLARNVATECKRLPLALETVGRSLRGKTRESFWEESLRKLKENEPSGIPGYLTGVYQPLLLSYDNLETDEAKYFFLLCCLFPEDSEIRIENLVHYGVGLPIFSAIESISVARSRVNYIVEILKDRCLLMDARDESHVKMHDVIRDMALSIASTGEHKFKVSHDTGLREWPHESYTCISLTLGEAMTFQEGMHCPGLKALLLTFDLLSTTPILPGNFLNGRADLTLLSINGEPWFSNHVFRLPLSFLSSLTKLRVLLLHKCSFEDTYTSFLGLLKNLEILNCRRSDIQELPNEIIALSKLKLLDMTGCWKLKNIAPGVIPALVNLEELCLMGCPIEWDHQETGDERRNASLAEVFSLKYLWFLGIWIQDLKAISQEMDYPPKLKSYSISIGPDPDPFFKEGSYGDLKRMSVSVDETMVFPDAISNLIKDAKELKLEGNGCKGIIELLGREGFVNITSLEIDRLGDVKILVEPMDRVIFPNLRHLELSSMNELEEICNGHPQVGSFSELKEITIRSCAKLKWVFPLSIAESLSKLESIDVRDCPVVEEVFNGHPQLGSFPELKEITIRSCAKLKWVFPLSIAESLSKLESIDVRDCPFVEEVFNGHPQVGSFSELKKITIDGCAKLKWVLPLSIAESLCKLESIDVSDCPVMEEVFKESESGITTVKFPNVKNMELRGLPGLGAWCKAVDAIIEFPSIESLAISAVSSNFKIFGNLQLADKVTCTKLKYSCLRNLGMEIFYREVPIGFFSGVKVLVIAYFHRLRVLFSLIVFKDLVNLKDLIVEDCVMLENIVEMENEDKKHTNVTIQKLKELRLSKLPKICYFWPFTCALEFPSLETVKITDCPMMETFAVVHLGASSSIPKFFGQQVTCPKLQSLTLEGLKISGLLFSPETPIASLGALSWLEIKSCHNLKSLFTSRMFEGLTSLRRVRVTDCSLFEEVITEDENENVDEMVVNIPKLESLQLRELPKLRWFSHTRRDLELSFLQFIDLSGCTEIMKSGSFCFGGGSVRIPSGVNVRGISDPEFACQFFFPTQSLDFIQHLQEEDTSDDGCFMLLSSDLSLTWDWDEDLSVVKGTSNAFFLDRWKKACGKFDMEKLSPGITYEIVFAIMLLKSLYWDEDDQLELMMEGDQLETMMGDDKREHEVKNVPRQQWIEILVGELTPSSGQCGYITFSLQKNNNYTRVALKFASIRPKNIA